MNYLYVYIYMYMYVICIYVPIIHPTNHRCDALMRHACGARATTRWCWDAHRSTEAAEREMPYRVTASRALVAGEELTVDYRTLSYRGLVERSTDPPPAPAVGALGFCCECCGGRVFR